MPKEGSTRKPIPRALRGQQRGRQRGRHRSLGGQHTLTQKPLQNCNFKLKNELPDSNIFNERTLVAIFSDFLLYDQGFKAAVPNVYMDSYEADIAGLDHNGFLQEFEIKCTLADFHRDFTDKLDKHRKLASSGSWQLKFNYVAPEGVIPHDLIPDYANLFEVVYSKSYANLRYCCKVNKIINNKPRVHVKPATKSQLTKLLKSSSTRLLERYREAARHLGGCNR